LEPLDLAGNPAPTLNTGTAPEPPAAEAPKVSAVLSLRMVVVVPIMPADEDAGAVFLLKLMFSPKMFAGFDSV
jgi:hypothetical protein